MQGQKPKTETNSSPEKGLYSHGAAALADRGKVMNTTQRALLKLAESDAKVYCKKFGLRAILGYTCVHRILKTLHHGSLDECRGPHADHNRGFRNPQTKEVFVTEQPYFGQEPATLEQITRDVEAFAKAHGLKVRVSTDESWALSWADGFD